MKRTFVALLIAVILVFTLAGCGGKDTGAPQFSDIEATVPELDSVSIDAPDYGFSDIETSVPELESGSIDAPDYGFSDIETSVPELESGSIDAPDYGFSPIEITTPAPLESVTIQAPEFNFEPIKVIPPSGDLTAELHIPDYNFSQISVEGVDLSIPQLHCEISPVKIGSIYTDTYTVPRLQIDVPDFDAPELESVFVGIANNLSPEDQQTLAGMSDGEFAEIAAVQLQLSDVLLETYKFSDITVAIDPITGSIPIDATLLFDTDKYELKPEGKIALRTVFTVYYSVISRPEFRDTIGSIVLEGHTDTEGNYEYNQQLSEKRAQAVYDFLLSDECGLPDRDFLAGLLTTVGRSYDNPVYAADGTVDMAASRRVEIHVTPNLAP